MELIKTKRIGNKNLSLLYFEDCKGYEVQYSDKETILEFDGMYPNKKDALKVFNDWEKFMVIERLIE